MAGALGTSTAMTLGLIWFRSRLMLLRESTCEHLKKKLELAVEVAKIWNAPLSNVLPVSHRDPSFTGGIVGFGKNSIIIVPTDWVGRMSASDLAALITRRSLAIQSGSYSRGLAIAAIWNLSGLVLCASFLPGAGVGTVAQLATTLSGFAIWSFVGLLVLPTSSRKASLQMDYSLAKLGAPRDVIVSSARWVDDTQDSEPHRPKWIERIFHPIPSVDNRRPSQKVSGPTAWNVARNSLFLSWACAGFLARAVHCNLGKPELWTMLPSD